MGTAVISSQRPAGELVKGFPTEFAALGGSNVNGLLSHDLIRLKQGGEGPRLSLFLPLSPGSPRATKTRIRAKNALASAEHALRSEGLPNAQVNNLVGLARQALEDARPLGDQHLGVAVFADADNARAYQVPLRLPELAVVGDRFFITPLLPSLSMQGEFFLLTLTQNSIQLFRGTSLSLEPVDVEGLELAAWTTMPPPRAPQVHAFVADRGGHRSHAIFHGVDRETDERKTRALQHFRGTDRALREVLEVDRAPLVLAGARQLQVLYRAVNTYPRLLLAGIDGNPEQMNPEQLHRQAWVRAEPELQRGRSAAIKRYLDLRGTGLTVDNAEEAHRAAVEGQVDTLLIRESACSWNSTGNDPALIRLGCPPAVEEQLDFAVVDTLCRAGAVFVVPDADMPEQSSAAAILRY
jgi:hypothetical protein